jgi:hypothetical protein
VVVAFNLGQGVTDDEPGATPSSQQPGPAAPQKLEIASVTDFDPDADPPQENPETAALAIDGDPATAWRTSTYFDPLNLLKDGVGLLVDLGRPADVTDVSVQFLGSPTSFEILAADESADAPTSTAGLTRVARESGAGTSADVHLEEPVATRFLVVWLTDLPPADGGFKGQVAEVGVQGRPAQ